MFADAVFSIVGWLIFGSAWQGVRSGCHRLFKIVIVLLLCLVAHYVWAICWPVISLCTAVIFGVVWVVRSFVRKLGTLIYWAQRAAGGVPEATGAEFIGPGTGRIPETSDLRTFKKVGTQDKWVLVRREGLVAVFKLGTENQTIRTAGLYVPVEADTMRGDSAIVEACRGHDRLHLCRHLNCAEDGQHFKEYCLAKDFDAEKFQLRTAELEATKAGRTVWAWLWAKKSSPAPTWPLEFGSESETEVVKCQACKVRWSDADGDVRLSRTACSSDTPVVVSLLVEDQFDEGGAAVLCARHALDYERKRRPQGCKVEGCDRVGVEEVKNLRLCKAHAAERRPSARKRSPGRLLDKGPGGDDSEEPDLPPRGDDGRLSLRDVQSLLQEVKNAEEKPGKVARTRSPGHTPKSSIQRNLARLGMLDSPDRPPKPPALEDFFDQYVEGKDLGLSEGDIRRNLAVERGVDLKVLTAQVLQQALQEQGRGQKGLSKFIRVWQGELESGPPTSSKGSSVPSWDVVDLGSEPAVSTPEKERSPPQIRIGEPGIFGQEDRKAGASEAKTTDFEDIARAIQSQTAELTSLVKNHTESTALPAVAGTLKGLNRQSEELVFLLRACNQYQVTIGAGEQGQALANALLSAQVGASTKLRKAGFKQKVTPRLAIGIAGPFWGSREKYTLAASDFVPQTDAEEIRSGKPGGDQRPAAPTKFEDWEARVRRQNDVWCLVYGLEWRRVRNHALELLTEWHQSEPRKWPLSVVSDIWEELHWRFFEELKEILRLLKKEAGRETMSLQDIKFHALLPNASGRAWLELPRTFDLKNPEGWFASEVMPRIERRQERVLWRLTWEGGRGSKTQGGAHAGGNQSSEKEDKPNLKSLWGPKLSTEEINRAKERAPVDKDGVLLCWGALTHMGCSNASCQRSHAGLQGRLEGLDPCVQMQFLRRGGLKRMKAETRESATDKIRNLRAGVAKDKAEKVANGRKSGQGEPTETADGGATRAGGEKVVRIWDVPEEFEAIDFTQAESDMREKLQGPDPSWLREPVKPVEHLVAADGETAPSEAKALVARAKEMKDGPVLSQLAEASDDLYAWAAARVANEPEATLEDILGDMATYGIGELAAEAADILERVVGKKAGASVAVHVGDTTWEPGCPGRAMATIQGTEWTVWGYREEVHMTEELAAILRQADEGLERRQCVVKTIAAGLVWRKLARQPSLAEAEDCAVQSVYKGVVVAETVTGSAWQEGGWVMWAVIWRGHMMLLEPPHNLDVAGTLEAWNPHDTPAWGF